MLLFCTCLFFGWGLSFLKLMDIYLWSKMGLVNALEIRQLAIFVTNVSDTPKKFSLDLLVASKFAGIYVKSLLLG